jgi:cell division protein FtsL
MLVGFVVVATAVIWRRGYGVAQAMEFRQLDRQRIQLQSQRAALERQIHELTGRSHLGALAEGQLDMRVPADSQVIVLPAPGAAITGRPHAAP